MNRTGIQPQHDYSLQIFQANVGRSSPSHDIALALAAAEQFDIIILQEPYTESNIDRLLTKTHRDYRTYLPQAPWTSEENRPRVLTYARRNSPLQVEQYSIKHRDLLWITVNQINIINIYRAQDCNSALD